MLLSQLMWESLLSSGRFRSLIIEGNAEAKLVSLIEKLPDPGVTGAASFQTDKYVDVLPRIRPRLQLIDFPWFSPLTITKVAVVVGRAVHEG